MPTCSTYLTRSVPGESGTITLTLGGVTVPYDPTGATGWRWADADASDEDADDDAGDAAAE